MNQASSGCVRASDEQLLQDSDIAAYMVAENVSRRQILMASC
jgi:hypothetical protein